MASVLISRCLRRVAEKVFSLAARSIWDLRGFFFDLDFFDEWLTRLGSKTLMVLKGFSLAVS